MKQFKYGLVITCILFSISWNSFAQPELSVSALSYSPDGRYVAGAAERVGIWDGATGNELLNADINFEYSNTFIFDIAWHPNSHQFALLGTDGIVRILDVSSPQTLGNMLHQFEVQTMIDVRSIEWSPDGREIAIGGDEAAVKVEFWDAENFAFIGATPHIVHAYSLAWHPDPQRNLLAAATAGDTTINLFNRTEFMQEIDCPHCDPEALSFTLSWNNDGSLLAVGHTDNAIYIVNANTNTIITTLQVGARLQDFVWSYDNNYLITHSSEGLHMWHATTGDLITLNYTDETSLIAASPISSDLFIFDNINSVATVQDIDILANQPPTVSATIQGGDTVVHTDTESAMVNLQGAGSDTDGTIISYEWTNNGAVIATEVNPQVTLSAGVHTLTVTDDDRGEFLRNRETGSDPGGHLHIMP